MSNSYEIDSLKDLLNFDYKTEDIYSVQGRMRALIEYYKINSELACLRDFLKVYCLVTEKVVDSRFQQDKYFSNVRELNKLDVIFCHYYFRAVKEYVMHGATISPWVNSFRISSEHNAPFINVLMGINSHINGDLPICLLEMDFKSKSDFDKVSSILYAVIPSVLSYLAFERMDFYGAFGLLAKKFIEDEFNTLIVKWRSNAYNNYKKLKNSKNTSKDIKFIKESTETISENIYNIFKNEVLNPINLINDLNKLEVIL